MSPEAHRLKEIILNFIVPIICLGVSGVLFFLIIYPSIKNSASLDAELSAAKSTRDVLKDKLSKLHRFIDFKSVLEENSNLVNTVLPDEEFVPGLLDQINQLSDESGMQLSKLSYSVSDAGIQDGADPAAAAYNAVAVSLGSEGSYPQMLAFMEAIENASRIVNITTFRFSATEREKDTRSMTYVLHAPYLSAQSNASTDEPLTLDVTSSDFLNFINKIKSLRYFAQSGDISKLPVEVIQEDIIDDEEIEIVEESTPATQPETPVSGGGF